VTPFATRLAELFLLPPLAPLLLVAIGLLALRWHPRAGRLLAWIGVLSLYALATPYVGRTLISSLESTYPPLAAPPPPAGAIVVLGAGVVPLTPGHGGDALSRAALERARHAARLHRATGKPILAAGGSPLGNTAPEAALMRAALVDEFRVAVRWSEESSRNTLENAANSRIALERAGIGTVYLVTHAWHMPRAVYAFEHAGIAVVPVPVGYSAAPVAGPLEFIASASGLQESSIALREMIGLAWYRLKSALP
jgi:uncharacterized SAM-binding protein YcdF (DUF218 family)